MKNLPVYSFFLTVFLVSACGENSSPDGRMSLKIENLQREMLDSLQQQNKAILDSLGKIRQELREIRQSRK